MDTEIGKLNERIENCMEFLPNENCKIKRLRQYQAYLKHCKRASDGVTKTVGNELKYFAEAIEASQNANRRRRVLINSEIPITSSSELTTSIKENLVRSLPASMDSAQKLL